MISEKEVSKKVIEKFNSIKGIIGVIQLSEDQIIDIFGLESRALENVLGGLAKGVNEGLDRVIQSDAVFSVFTDRSFEWPKDSLFQIVSSDGIIGEEIRDNEKLEELKMAENVIIVGDCFYIRTDKLAEWNAFKEGLFRAIFPPINFKKEVKDIPEVLECVGCFTSGPCFEYLKLEFEGKIDLSDPGYGFFLVGVHFDPVEVAFSPGNRPNVFLKSITKSRYKSIGSRKSPNFEKVYRTYFSNNV